VAISFIGSAENYGSATSAITSGTHGLTFNVGDFIMCLISQANTSGETVNDIVDNNTNVFNFLRKVSQNPHTLTDTSAWHFFWRIAGASEETVFDFTSDVTNAWGIHVLQFRGTSEGTPFAVEPKRENVADTASASTISAPSIAVPVGAMAIMIAGGGHTNALSGADNSFTNMQANAAGEWALSSNYRLFASGGGTGLTTVTWTPDNDGGAMHFALGEAPIITDVDTDEMWNDGDTDLPITGSGFI
jgi:hypothetical protein